MAAPQQMTSTCPICLDDIQLPGMSLCGTMAHGMHPACAMRIFFTSDDVNCPLCRAPVNFRMAIYGRAARDAHRAASQLLENDRIQLLEGRIERYRSDLTLAENLRTNLTEQLHRARQYTRQLMQENEELKDRLRAANQGSETEPPTPQASAAAAEPEEAVAREPPHYRSRVIWLKRRRQDETSSEEEEETEDDLEENDEPQT